MQLSDVLFQMMTQNNAAGQPTDMCIGTVTKAKPLEISVNPAMDALKEEVLYLTDAVRDYNVDITVDWFTENESGGGGYAEFAVHKHAVKGRKEIHVHNDLQVGEKVLLLRVLHGQRFIVLSRLKER